MLTGEPQMLTFWRKNSAAIFKNSDFNDYCFIFINSMTSGEIQEMD